MKDWEASKGAGKASLLDDITNALGYIKQLADTREMKINTAAVLAMSEQRLHNRTMAETWPFSD